MPTTTTERQNQLIVTNCQLQITSCDWQSIKQLIKAGWQVLLRLRSQASRRQRIAGRNHTPWHRHAWRVTVLSLSSKPTPLTYATCLS